jgi:hypothetical protein
MAKLATAAAAEMADAIEQFKVLQDQLDAGNGCDADDHDQAIKRLYRAAKRFRKAAQTSGRTIR